VRHTFASFLVRATMLWGMKAVVRDEGCCEEVVGRRLLGGAGVGVEKNVRGG
jgi:hypothetical protein